MILSGSPSLSSKQAWHLNFLGLPLIRWIVKRPFYPYILQAGALGFFLLLIYFGWGQPTFDMNSAAEKLYRKLNFTTFVLWGLWWPSMIWVAVFLGRAWCHVCPLELLMNLSERLGRKLGVSQRFMPKVFRNGLLIVAAYLTVQFSVASFHIHRAPHGATLFLISLAVLALLCGFLFTYRSFCSFVCPVGVLLNCYSRNAPFELRTIDRGVCEGCRTRDCRSLKTYTRWKGRGCPSLLNPPKLRSNKDCLLCMQCVKACPYDNIRFGTRRFFQDIVPGESLSMAIPLFLVIITGFLTYELTLNGEIKAIFLAPPHWIENVMRITDAHWIGFLKGAWVLIVFPAAIWIIFAALYRLFSPRMKFSFWFKAYPVAFVPLLAAAHLSKSFDKWNAWLKGVGLPFRDPMGKATFQAIYVDKIFQEPGAILTTTTLRWLPTLVLVIGGFVTLKKLVQTDLHLRTNAVAVSKISGVVPFAMAIFIVCIYLFNVWHW